MAKKRMDAGVLSKPASPRAPESAGPAAGPRVKRDHIKVTHMFTREQAEALRVEAYRRAQERGSRKPDESEIVREAVELWLKAR